MQNINSTLGRQQNIIDQTSREASSDRKPDESTIFNISVEQ